MQSTRKLFFIVLLSIELNFLQGQLVSIPQTAINRNLTILSAAINAAGLNGTLATTNPLTVFAPTDLAFSQLPAGVVADLVLPENNVILSKILRYHVIGSNTTAASVPTTLTNVASIQGGQLSVVRNGSAVRVNNANVLMGDIFATNGIIHTIDKVLLPSLDIVETALTNGAFRTLITALRKADLISTLQGAGPFTVFAPNDAAFAKIDSTTLTNLLKPENKATLSNILKYHVVSQRVMAANLTSTISMLAGGSVTITRDGTVVKINNATILATDISTTNGVIHIIDTVLMPANSASGISTLFNFSLLSLIFSTIYFYRF